MDPLLGSTLIKLCLPLLAVALLLFVTRKRGLSWRDDLGFARPRLGVAFAWLGAWCVWLALGELAIRTFQLDQAKPWPEYSPLIVVLRVLAIGFAGPLAEEVVMRGLFLHRLRRTRLGAAGAVVVVAVVWAAFHVRYGAGTLALIALDGLFLGSARIHSRSLWVPIALHVIGNLLSIAQSLAAGAP